MTTDPDSDSCAGGVCPLIPDPSPSRAATVPAGWRKGIPELTELMAAAGGLAGAIAEARADDGEVSWPERMGLLWGHWRPVIKGLSGIGEMAQEIKDLGGTTPEGQSEVDALVVAFLESGGRAVIPADARVQDLMDIGKKWIEFTLQCVREIQNHGGSGTPVAKVIE